MRQNELHPLICPIILLLICSSCNKETDLSNNSNENTKEEFEKIVNLKINFHGLRDVDATLLYDEVGKRYRLKEGSDALKLRNTFYNNTEESHFYIGEDNTFHIFKTQNERNKFIESIYRDVNNSTIRTCDYQNIPIELQFYKHKNHTGEYLGLKRLVTSNFTIPRVNVAHPGSNDEISSMKGTNLGHLGYYMVVFHEDEHYGGDSAAFSVHQCVEVSYLYNMKTAWGYYHGIAQNYVTDGPFNDETSSISGYFY